MYAEKKKSDGKLSADDFTKPNMQPLSKGTGPDEMNQLAMKIADQLDKDATIKK